MNNNEKDKILSTDIEELLIEMHKGTSLKETLRKIMDIVRGVRHMEDKKFIFLLEGIEQQELNGKALLEKDKSFIKGWNESAEENNFAIKLAKECIES